MALTRAAAHTILYKMEFNPLSALSPLDGRYAAKLQPLAELFSEQALMRCRLEVEIRWLETVADISAAGHEVLQRLLENFHSAEAQKIKQFEATTNHDVKAVEYYLRDACEAHTDLKTQTAWIHFAATSETIS